MSRSKRNKGSQLPEGLVVPQEPNTTPTQQDVHDAFGTLYKQLSDAYWVATTIEDKDRIRGIADAVFDILTELNKADIQSRTAEYAALKQSVESANKRLAQLQQDIDKIIHVVGIATSLSQAVDKALAQATKFFQ